jgi:glycosyltransferase involved in cell wall biosynthesis
VPSSKPLVSIVCPAYQEEAVLALFHVHLERVLRSLGDRFAFEVLYVDDGSSDGTLPILRTLAAGDPRVRYLSLSRNFGKEAALCAGFEHAAGDAVITLDTDLQHPPEVIGRLLEQWQGGFDVVLTERERMPYTSWWRGLAARTFARLLAAAARDPAPATSDFLLLSRRVVDAIGRLPEAHRFTRGLVRWVGFPSATVLFKVAERGAGVSKFTLARLFQLASDGFFSFSRLPLQLVVRGGMAFLGLAFIYAVLAPWWGPIRNLGPAGLHIVTFLLLLGTGLCLSAVGVVGQYATRIFEQVKQRPLYLVKEQCRLQTRGKAAEPADTSLPIEKHAA